MDHFSYGLIPAPLVVRFAKSPMDELRSCPKVVDDVDEPLLKRLDNSPFSKTLLFGGPTAPELGQMLGRGLPPERPDR